MVDLQGLVNLNQCRALNGSVKETLRVINENGTYLLQAIQTFSIVYFFLLAHTVNLKPVWLPATIGSVVKVQSLFLYDTHSLSL